MRKNIHMKDSTLKRGNVRSRRCRSLSGINQWVFIDPRGAHPIRQFASPQLGVPHPSRRIGVPTDRSSSVGY